MSKFRRCFLWYLLLNKRLLRKKSFVAVLCLVPLLSFGLRLFASEDNSILHILIIQEDTQDTLSGEIIDRLSRKEVISYEQLDSLEEAKRLLLSGKADAIWIFPADFHRQLLDAISSDWYSQADGLIRIIQREDDTFLQLSRVQLFGEIYPDLAYDIYIHYMQTAVSVTPAFSEEDFRAYFENNRISNKLFSFAYMDSDEQEHSINYLTAPLRGMLGLWLMLCGFCASLYWIHDNENGIFNWLSDRNRGLLGIGYHMIIVMDAAVAMLLALKLSGVWAGLVRELLMILLYVPGIVLFTDLLRKICRKEQILCASIVLLLIAMILFCPVFFKLQGTYAIGHIFPPYYYLQAIHNNTFLIQQLVYLAVLLTADLLTIKQ